MNVVVTGGAGFIGSHVVESCLARGWRVRIVDNFRTGRDEFVDPRAELHVGSILDAETLIPAFDGADWVIHMAANAEGRRGLARPRWDIEQNVLGTASVLETMHALGVPNIFYASSGSVYGNTQMERIPEDCPFPTQTSLYGASKIAGEGLVGAYVEGMGVNAVVGRWMQAIGPRYLHGHVIDFVRKLQRDPHRLTILGDGEQAKSGLHVKDLAEGIVHTVMQHDDGLAVYNFGSGELVTIDESARLIASTMGLLPELIHEGNTWPGDNPHTWLDSSKAHATGWKAELTVKQAITDAAYWLLNEATYL